MIYDDTEVLDRMIADMMASDQVERPGNYWQVYFDRLVPGLRDQGLRDFRASGNPVFRSMGVSGIPFLLAEDLEPYWFNDLNPWTRRFFHALTRAGIYRRLVHRHVDYHRQTLFAFQNAYFQLALQTDPDQDILRIADSGEGNPRDFFCPEGHKGHGYTISFLRYMLEYLWAKRRIDFANTSIVFEIGGGYGGQAEVMLKIHDDLRYVICDIPPQLYIQEQYLKAVFPGQVTGYLDTCDSLTIGLDDTKRITVVAPWQIAGIKGTFDVLWNSASFQEMEPAIVANYAAVLGPKTRHFVYLKECPEGVHIAARQGEEGVIDPVTIDHYLSYFSAFELQARDDTVHVSCSNPHAIPYFTTTFYDQMLFRRRAHTVLPFNDDFEPGENAEPNPQ